MTSQEIYVIEQHTRALRENTTAMQNLTQILGLIGSKKFLGVLENAADTNMNASRRIQEAADEIASVAKQYVEASENNQNAARQMIEAAEINRCL